MTADSGHTSTTELGSSGAAVARERDAGLPLRGDLVDRLAREEPLTWWNPAVTDTASGLAASGIDAATVADAAARRARPGGVLIFHDGFDGRGGYRGRSVDAVTRTVDTLLDRGYRFVTVPELWGEA